MFKRLSLGVAASLMLLLTACGQLSAPADNNDTVEPQQVDVGFCEKSLGYPHKSTTNGLEVDSKASISCPPNKNYVFVVGTVYLYKKAPDGSWRSYAVGKPYGAALSATRRVTIPDYKLLAAGPCVNGTYYSRLKAEYKNVNGGIIKVGAELVTPATSVICR